MATWKKIIVSGSTADLANINVDNIVSASTFSGSFVGDGSGLTGITATALDIDNFGSDLTSITIAGTDKLALSDAGTEGRVNISQLATPLAGTGLEASSGTIRIATAAAGTGLTGGGGSALEVDFTDATFQSQVSGAFTDTSASIASDIAGITTSFDLTGDSGTDTFNSGETLTFAGGNAISVAVTDNTVTVNGAAGLISSSVEGDAQGQIKLNGVNVDVNALGSGDSPTFSALTVSNNAVIQGDLTVTGDTFQAQVTNLNVEDQFILLNSGSTTGDSGIIFGGSNGTANSGHALILDNSYNSNDGRLAIKVTDTAATSDADFAAGTTGYYVAGVYEGTEANAATALADHKGNIRIEGEDIYIYS